jgi:hypothetical protein
MASVMESAPYAVQSTPRSLMAMSARVTNRSRPSACGRESVLRAMSEAGVRRGTERISASSASRGLQVDA